MSVINTNGTGGGLWAATTTWAGGVVPVAPNTAHVLNGDTIDQVPAGQICSTNDGTITTNHGTVTLNIGTVTLSAGGSATITNNGTMVANRGHVSSNNGTITLNAVGGGGAGVVSINNGTVTLQATGASVLANNGTVGTNRGLVTINALSGVVALNDVTGPGVVTYNYGTVTTNNGMVRYMMDLAAVAGPTSIEPVAFVDPGVSQVREGKAYRFDSLDKTGTGKESNVPLFVATAQVAYNDHYWKFDDNVGKP